MSISMIWDEVILGMGGVGYIQYGVSLWVK